MIDFYDRPTPNGWKVAIMLEGCGLAYRTIPVNIGCVDQFTPEFLEAAADTCAGGGAFDEFAGEPHAFITRDPASANAQRAPALIADFIHHQTG
jgi:hypothetical protein